MLIYGQNETVETLRGQVYEFMALYGQDWLVIFAKENFVVVPFDEFQTGAKQLRRKHNDQ